MSGPPADPASPRARPLLDAFRGQLLVRDIRDRLGNHKKALLDLPRRQERLDGVVAEAKQLLRELGRDGDWLVIRGYHASDNLVSSLTNLPFSHAAVLDTDRDEVIAPVLEARPDSRSGKVASWKGPGS